MGRYQRQQRRESRKIEHDKLKTTFDDMHKKAVYLKRVYRQRGIDLPFYDFYDSYFEAFGGVASQAKQQFPSLLDIVEAEDTDYFGMDHSQWAPGMQQIVWQTERELDGYGTGNDASNINGYTNAFRAQDGQVKTAIVIRKAIPRSRPHREYKYVLKLIALLHELGHVYDIEREINFKHAAGTFDAVEAEVFAHLYSLERMAKTNYYQCFNMLIEGLRRHAGRSDFMGEVAATTLKRMPEYRLVDVTSIPLTPVTQADLEVLGADGRRALGLPG